MDLEKYEEAKRIEERIKYYQDLAENLKLVYEKSNSPLKVSNASACAGWNAAFTLYSDEIKKEILDTIKKWVDIKLSELTQQFAEL